MSSVDKAWLGMDSHTNLMIINGLLLFDQMVDVARLQDLCEHRLAQPYARFRQRIIESPSGTGRLYWEDDPHFDVRKHIRRLVLPAPGDMSALQRLLGELMSNDLEPGRPLWHIYLIENNTGGCAIFGRIHHAIADGIALVQVLLSLTDDSAECPPPVPPPPSKGSGFLSQTLRTVSNLSQTAATLTQTAARTLQRSIENPAYARELVETTALVTAASAAILAKLLLIPPDRPSVLKGELGALKRVSWSAPFSLEEIKTIGRRHQATVNDVVVAAMAGALRGYLQHRGDQVDDGILRVMAAVNLRPLGQGPPLGNQFSLVYLGLPISLATPRDRLVAVKERMTVLKHSPEPLITFQVLNVLGMLPGALARRCVEMFASKVTAVLTNVPGPPQTRYLAGKPVRRLVYWAPQSGQIGIGISIISYAGELTVAVMVDEKLAPDADRLLAGLQTELVALGNPL